MKESVQGYHYYFSSPSNAPTFADENKLPLWHHPSKTKKH
nr:MAG TPA: hypothetical protein [Caudoviricetes sp.]